MAANEQLIDLVDRMPDADNRGMLTENIDKDAIEKAIAAIHAGGQDNVVALVDMLGEPGSEADVKPRYALHCLTNHVLVVRDEAGRKRLCEALASQLGGDRPKQVQAYLCQELGWAGGRESVAALGKLLADEELCGPASMALVAIGDGAAAELRAAWPKAIGGARLHVMHALAAVAEPKSSKTFTAALKDEDREIRIAAAAGLGSLGEAGSADDLLAAADAARGWERIQIRKSCVVLAERLAAQGKSSDAKRIHEHFEEA